MQHRKAIFSGRGGRSRQVSFFHEDPIAYAHLDCLTSSFDDFFSHWCGGVLVLHVAPIGLFEGDHARLDGVEHWCDLVHLCRAAHDHGFSPK